MTLRRARTRRGTLASTCLACASLLIPFTFQAHAGQAGKAGSPDASSLVEGRIDAAVRDLKNDPRFKGMTDAQRHDNIEFVAGNLIFATIHEVGHMLISEMGLPVLGREEDAADAFAVLTGLRLNNGLSDRVLMQSARGWFLSDRRNQDQGIKTVFYDEHGLDRQRAYNIVCLMVGGDPEKYAVLADMTQLPKERQGTCQGDFSNSSWSWNKLLTPHIRAADQPKTQVTVTYADSGPYGGLEQSLRKLQFFELMADHLADRYVWRGPIGLEIQTCGSPGAHWDLPLRRIIMCYELAVDFADLYRGYGLAEKPSSLTTATGQR